MIDFDDADDLSLIGFFVDGPLGLIILIAAIVVFFIAVSNSNECSLKSCPGEATPKLMDNSCLCLTEAK